MVYCCKQYICLFNVQFSVCSIQKNQIVTEDGMKDYSKIRNGTVVMHSYKEYIEGKDI